MEAELIDILNQGIEKGFWAEVLEKEFSEDTIFLPYNYASKRDTLSTTKTRLVHDLAAKAGEGTFSVNEAMLNLPDIEKNYCMSS